MSLEFSIDGRKPEVKLIESKGSRVKISIDGRVYDADIVKFGNGLYSIIIDGQSFSIEMIEEDTPKHYVLNTFYKSFNVEIIDAEKRYQRSRLKGSKIGGENNISSPMPGKVVGIPVKVGQKVEAGQPVIIISAMKMESELKVKNAGKVKEIRVKEGAVIDANQILMIIE
ncbi:MAG: biotin/lipoyl-containing protein [Bacteroidota bacterium]|nr:biotin/lipoyl-containing protein [Bacteroidota bacterium]